MLLRDRWKVTRSSTDELLSVQIAVCTLSVIFSVNIRVGFVVRKQLGRSVAGVKATVSQKSHVGYNCTTNG